jgi:hypothetical protein
LRSRIPRNAALDRGRDPIVVLCDIHLAVEVELVENALDQLAHALGGGIGPVGGLRHDGQAIRPPAESVMESTI